MFLNPDVVDYYVNQMTEEEKMELKKRLMEKKMEEKAAAIEENLKISLEEALKMIREK